MPLLLIEPDENYREAFVAMAEDFRLHAEYEK